MRTATKFSGNLVNVICGSCGVPWAMAEEFHVVRLSDHATFYCPNGCRRHYPRGKSETELRAEAERHVASLQEDVRAAQAEAVVLKGQLTKARKAKERADTRAKAAMCPVPGCNRQLVQMARHLSTKHPEFIHEQAKVAEHAH